MGLSHPIDARAGAKLAVEETVEKGELGEAVAEGDAQG